MTAIWHNPAKGGNPPRTPQLVPKTSARVIPTAEATYLWINKNRYDYWRFNFCYALVIITAVVLKVRFPLCTLRCDPQRQLACLDSVHACLTESSDTGRY